MRFEYKYIVHESKIQRLRELARPYLEVDKYAKNLPGNQYTVRSIYFDTPQFTSYYDKIEGIKNRRKLRIRGYNLNESNNNGVFLEIKKKLEIPIKKYRSFVLFEDAQELLSRSKIINDSTGLDEKKLEPSENTQRFLFQLYSKKMQPVVLITYEREAYLYKFDSTIRITFDKNLRGKAYPALDELYTEDGMQRSLSNYFILEIKFNNHFPVWMNPIISALNIQKCSASKYVICMDTNKVVSSRLTKSSIFIKSNILCNNN